MLQQQRQEKELVDIVATSYKIEKELTHVSSFFYFINQRDLLSIKLIASLKI